MFSRSLSLAESVVEILSGREKGMDVVTYTSRHVRSRQRPLKAIDRLERKNKNQKTLTGKSAYYVPNSTTISSAVARSARMKYTNMHNVFAADELL